MFSSTDLGIAAKRNN